MIALVFVTSNSVRNDSSHNFFSKFLYSIDASLTTATSDVVIYQSGVYNSQKSRKIPFLKNP